MELSTLGNRKVLILTALYVIVFIIYLCPILLMTKKLQYICFKANTLILFIITRYSN